MTTYKTGNAVPSTDVRDLFDNAENYDTALNDRTSRTWADRLGVLRKSWHGLEQDFDDFMVQVANTFQEFLVSSGYEDIGDYAAGLVIAARNQIFWRDGELYRASGALELPYTTTGVWAEESGLFVSVGDAALRQELANLASNPEGGASLVGTRQPLPGAIRRDLQSKGEDRVSIRDFGDAGQGDDETDTSALELAVVSGARSVRIPAGTYRITRTITIPDGVELVGDGVGYEHFHPTTLLFVGTGAKSFSVPGAVGISVANPDAGAPYLGDSGTRGDTYEMIDLTVPFSAAVILGRSSALRNLGIVPNFDGIAGYNGTDGRLSDDWDVGVWCRNSSGWDITRCTVFGHWRKSAQLVTSSDISDGRIPENELGHAEHTHLSGFRSLVVRAPDSIVGDNYGFAGTDWINCYFRSLRHQSGHLATSSALNTPFQSPSGCIEMTGSGNWLRGIQFLNCTVISSDDFILFSDVALEIQFDGCYFEAKATKVGGSDLAGSTGARIISTANSILMFNGQTKYGVDFSPYYVRESSVERYTAPAGVFTPNRARDSEYEFPVLSTSKGFRIQPGGIFRVWDSSLSGVLTVRNDGTASLAAGFDTLRTNNGFVSSGTNTIALHRSVSGSQVPALRVFSSGSIQLGTGEFVVDGLLRPLNDGVPNIGASAARWGTVFAVTGAINTSDEREKQQVKKIDAAALRAWAKVEYCQFKFDDAVALKGDGARWHIGLIAQRVKEAFESEGIDAFEYGLLCYDEWEEQLETIGPDGGITQAHRPAGNRYGIRYEEALALECAYLRSRLA